MSETASQAVPLNRIEVSTRLFGVLSIPGDTVIRFPHGVPGFPDALRFVLVQAGAPGLEWLQSLDTPALCFLTIDADRIVPNAWPEFPDARVIVTLPGVQATATANVRAPILIDRTSRTGRQWIPVDCDYSTVHPFDLPALLDRRSC